MRSACQEVRFSEALAREAQADRALYVIEDGGKVIALEGVLRRTHEERRSVFFRATERVMLRQPTLPNQIAARRWPRARSVSVNIEYAASRNMAWRNTYSSCPE
jgi:hypothetical protein